MGVIIEEIFDDEESQEVHDGAEGTSQPTTQKCPSLRDTDKGVEMQDKNGKEEDNGHGPDKEGEGSRAGAPSPGDDDENDDDWVTVSREDANVDGTTNSTDEAHIEEEEEDDEDEDEMMSEEEKKVKIDRAEELKAKGNAHFSSQEYQKAIDAYTEALETSPLSAKKERSVYFANRAACFTYLEEYDEAAADCSNALDLDGGYVKAYLRRANAFEKLEEYDKGLADAQKVVELDPGNATAKAYITRIEPLAEKKREELKEEMVEKLKDLGNSLLGNFGLSLDNFKAEKDPNTGSYSIQFNK